MGSSRYHYLAFILVICLTGASCQSDPASFTAAPGVELLEQLPGEWYYAGLVADFPGVLVDEDEFPLAFVTTNQEVYVGRLPSSTSGDSADGVGEKGWSNDIDNRVNNVFASLAPYSSIGRLESPIGGLTTRVCSATLVDNRLILTAAHCVSYGGSVSTQGTFTPGLSAAGAPDGSVTTGGALIVSSYLTEGCHLYADNYVSTSCVARDWALVPFTPTATIPSGVAMMPVTTAPKAEQLTWTVWHAGYAACGYSHSPTPCPTSQWLDTGCILRHFDKQDASGDHRLARMSCDASTGQSGGPVVRQGTNQLMGVFSAEMCSSNCTSSQDTPNYILRITPTYLGQMQALFAAIN